MSFEARYPFTAQAKRLLQDLNVEEVTEEEVRNAEARIEAALHDKQVHESGEARPTLVSYALGRVLLAGMADEWVSRQYAAWEAKRAAKCLREDNHDQKLRALSEFFPSATSQNSGEWTVTVPDFAKWGGDLARQRVEKGKVYLSTEGVAELFKQAVERKTRDLQAIDIKKLPPLLKQRALELRQRLPYPEKTAAQYSGQYLDLDCVRSIREGVAEGKRYYGAMAIAIACVKDGITQSQAADVMQEYVSKCNRGSQPFTSREALQTLAWVYKHSGIGFSCKTMKEQGIIDHYCSNCLSPRSKANNEWQ